MARFVVQIVEAAEFLDQRRRGFLADARHAFDIVDRIAHQRLDVDERTRLDAEALAHLARAGGFVAHRIPQPHMRPDHLHEVLVGGDDHRIDLFLDPGGRQRGDHVVGLVALAHDALDPERVDHAIDVGNLHLQIVGRLGAVGLVFGEQVVAEGSLGRIENRADMGRMLLLDELEEHPDEAEHRVGRHPARVVQRRQREEGAEDVVRSHRPEKVVAAPRP